MELKKLPIGVDSFEKMITNEFYYVDKTGLIRDLLRNWGEVNLFTRPRRFGKSLNMSMLQHFFEIQERIGVVIEVKYAEDGSLDRWCNEALKQIEKNNYAARLVEDGMKSIIKYGIAFYKKHCKVVLASS